MPIIRKGVVVGGEYLGWKIFVDDDRDGGTGGYYLFLEKMKVKDSTIGLSMKRDFKPN